MSAARHWEFIEREAIRMGAQSEAVRKWRERGKVPHRWRLPLLDAAKSRRFRLDQAVFDNIPRRAAA